MDEKQNNYRCLIRNLRLGKHKKIDPLIVKIMHKIREANEKKDGDSKPRQDD